MLTIDQVKKLREETSISITECQKALKEANGDMEKAKEVIKKWGKEVAEKKMERVAAQGIIDTYVHSGKKIGVMVELRCESDFAARSADFLTLSHEICLQLAAMPCDETSFASQAWIKDPSKTIKDLMDEYIAKIGEKIVLDKFVRYEL
jgi:elongation factor Ts